MSVAEQDALRRRMRTLRQMTPARREQLLDRVVPETRQDGRNGGIRERGAEPETPPGTEP
jgi:hypothetical protein